LKTGGQFDAEKGGQFNAENGGQFGAKRGGQLQRNFHIGVFIVLLKKMMWLLFFLMKINE